MSTVNLEPSGLLQLCPGSNITFVCTNNQTTVLAWRSFEQDYPDGDSYFFNDGNPVDMVERFSGSFMVVLLSTSPLISTATLTNNFGPQLNGTNLTCSSTTYTNILPSEAEYAVLTLKGTQNTCFIFTNVFCASVRRDRYIGRKVARVCAQEERDRKRERDKERKRMKQRKREIKRHKEKEH